MNKYILGVGHHPFSKKKEFRGFFDDVAPCLIATDYKAPKCVLELHTEGGKGEEMSGKDDFVSKKYKEFYKKNGYLPEFFNPYNCSKISDVSPTITSQASHMTSSSTVLVLEEREGELSLNDEIKVINPLKGKTEYGWHFEQEVYDPSGIARALKAGGGSGNIPKTVLKESEKIEDKELMNNKKEYEKKPFKYVSLFSGIGGFEQALNKFGGECVMASEIDKFAEKAYQTLYGHATVGDITKIDEKDVPDHEILVGGFPCQSFSVAGKQLGFNDSRGTMFFEVARIAKEKQPKALLLENVKGLVGHDKGKTLDTIVRVLNEIGYRVDFQILNSKYFGVPQNRERIFIVGVREDLIPNEPWKIEGSTVVPKGKRRISGYEGEQAWDLKTFNFDYPEQTEVTTRLKDILEDVVDEKFYISDEKTEKLIAQLEENGSHTETNSEPHKVGNIDIKGHDYIKRVYSTDGMSPTVPTGAGGNHEPKIAEEQEPKIDIVGNTGNTGHGNFNVFSDDGLGRTVAARDYKDPMRIAEEQFTAKKPDERLSQQAVETANNSNLEKEHGDFIQAYNHDHNKEGISPTLTTRPEGLKTAILPIVGEQPKYRIRKLTPKECFRLQSFSDEDFDKLVEAGISNSQLYKMAGNSVTINVIEAIMEKLQKYIID